jgi:hypothetical protein
VTIQPLPADASRLYPAPFGVEYHWVPCDDCEGPIDDVVFYLVMGRLIYRVRQFIYALTAPFTRNEVAAEVRQVLSSEQQALFARMRAADRQHAYTVYQALQASGPHPQCCWQR